MWEGQSKQNQLKQLCLEWMREFHPETLELFRKKVGIGQRGNKGKTLLEELKTEGTKL